MRSAFLPRGSLAEASFITLCSNRIYFLLETTNYYFPAFMMSISPEARDQPTAVPGEEVQQTSLATLRQVVREVLGEMLPGTAGESHSGPSSTRG